MQNIFFTGVGRMPCFMACIAGYGIVREENFKLCLIVV